MRRSKARDGVVCALPHGYRAASAKRQERSNVRCGSNVPPGGRGIAFRSRTVLVRGGVGGVTGNQFNVHEIDLSN